MLGIRRMLSFRRRNREREGEGQQGIVAGYGYQYGSKLSPSFAEMMNLYRSFPLVKGAIDELAETSVGHGGYFTCKDPEVLRVANEFAEEIELDELNQTMARELWATGNTVLEKLFDADGHIIGYVRLPISSFTNIKSDVYGNIVEVTQTLNGKRHVWREKDLEKLVWLKWNAIDADLVGVGLLEPLLREGVGYTWTDAEDKVHTEKRPPYASIIEETEDAMRKVLHRYTPRFLYAFHGVSDKRAKAYANQIKVLRPDDDIILSLPEPADRAKVEVERLSTDPRSRLDPFVEYFYNQMITALETPSLKLFLEAGFTEASARTAVQVLDRKVDAFRRFLKRKIENVLFKPVVMERMDFGEIKWRKCQLRWNWNPIEQPKVEIRDLILAYTEPAKYGLEPVVTREELRELLKKAGVELFEEEGEE